MLPFMTAEHNSSHKIGLGVIAMEALSCSWLPLAGLVNWLWGWAESGIGYEGGRSMGERPGGKGQQLVPLSFIYYLS